MQTDRLRLPLLATAQAQKEMTVNEALASLDAAVQAVVLSVAPSSLPVSPSSGQSWIIGGAATGAWAGHDGDMATWTAGGWRFLPSFDGMTVWSLADQMAARREAGVWVIGKMTANAMFVGGDQVVGARGVAITDPSGGSIVDSEARGAIMHILDALRTHGMIEI